MICDLVVFRARFFTCCFNVNVFMYLRSPESDSSVNLHYSAILATLIGSVKLLSDYVQRVVKIT